MATILTSIPSLARELGVSQQTVYRWLKAGIAPRPDATLGGWRVYSPEAAGAARAWWYARTQKRCGRNGPELSR